MYCFFCIFARLKTQNKIKSIIKALQPEAKIIEADYCNVDVDEIIETHNFDLEKVSNSAGWIAAFEEPEEEEIGEKLEYGIDTFVYISRKPIELDKFKKIIDKYEKQIIRSKGYLYLTESEEIGFIFEQIGKQKNLSQLGYWVAAMPEKDQKDILNNNPEIKEDWDDKVGDRMTKLVFIGKDMDKENIIKELDIACKK